MNIVCIIDSEILKKEDDIVVNPCGHLFHRNCLLEWLASSRTCPSCRSPSSAASLIKVYFENDDNKANDLHNELLKSNEKMASELSDFRDKANKQESELLELKMKYRDLSEKLKGLERTKQMDDMMLATLRNIKDESTTEILKLNRQLNALKLDLLAEKQLRRIHQTTLHELDPKNENYDIKNIPIDENAALPLVKSSSSSSLPWVLNSNEVKTSNNSNGAVKKEQNYVIPAKIQKANSDNDTRKQSSTLTPTSSSLLSDFSFRRAMKSSSFAPDGPAFSFGSTSNTLPSTLRTQTIQQQQLPESSSSSTAIMNDSPTRAAFSSFAFNFGSPSSFSSLFRFGNAATNTNTTMPSAEANTITQQTNRTPFTEYRELRSASANSINPRTSDR